MGEVLPPLVLVGTVNGTIWTVNRGLPLVTLPRAPPDGGSYTPR